MLARRGHNEGSITELKNSAGRVTGYRVRISVPGTGRRKSATFRTKAEAREWRTSSLAEARQGRLLAGRSDTLSAYLDAWLLTIKPHLKPRTFDSYQLNVDRLAPLIGHVKLDELRPAHVQEAYNVLQQTLAPRTVRQVHLTLHKALNDAMAEDRIARNVSQGRKLPRVAQAEMRSYTPEDVHALLVATSGDRFHALWAILATSGLRLGEALGLKWSDVDMSRKSLTIQRALQRQRNGAGLVFVEPKSATSRRTVELTATAVDALQSHLERQGFERRGAGETWNDFNLVFPSEVGTPLEQSRVHRHWRKAVVKARIPQFRIHDLRHTVASHLILAGLDSLEVARILGHSNAGLVYDVYGHVAPATKRRAANMLDEMYDQHRGPI